VIGLVLGLVDRGALSGQARLFLAVGVLGRYTTFSTFSYESIQMLGSGNVRMVVFNAAGQVVMGLLAASLGLAIVRSRG